MSFTSADELHTETLLTCPICGKRQVEIVLTQPDGYIPILQLNRCQGCQMVYLSPRLTPDSTMVVEDESEVYVFSMEVAESHIANAWSGIIRWLQSYVTSPTRRLLDIGCNRGLLLESAKRIGWEVTGVEISSESANRARNDYGLTVYSSLSELAPDQTFDLVTAWHVLEHTHDPLGFLSIAASRLCHGGVLAIQVPSFDFVDEFRARNQSGSILCTVHNFYFTEKTLRMLLSKTKLDILELSNDPNTLFLTAICRKPQLSFLSQLKKKMGIGLL